MKINIKNKTLPLVIFVFILLLGALLYQLRDEAAPNASIAKPNPDDELTNYAKVVYIGMHLSAIEEVGDANFLSFFKETINPKCPFYEPDGATYRSCLIDWKDGLLNVFNGGKTSLNNAQSYCEEIDEKYPESLQGEELYLDCMIYKLSSAKSSGI